MQSLRILRNPIRDQKTVLVFINQVRQHPCLWNQADEYYKNINARKDAWCAIARKVGYSVFVLRSKWRNLKVQYFKLRDEWDLKRRTQAKGLSCLRPTWFAYCSMEFLGNSKNVRQRRGQHKEYLILGEEQNKASEECDLNEIIQLEEEVEHYEATMEDSLAEATKECNASYDMTNGNLEEDTSTILYHEQNIADDGLEDYDISFEQRYLNEKRKSVLLYQLNEKLEKELQQQRAEVQLQRLNISSLEQQLKLSERKLAKLTKIPQENYDRIVSDEMEDTTETLVDGTTLTVHGTADAISQCDPLCSPTEIVNRDGNSENFQFMTNSIKKMQSVIENFANQSKRRYSGFGDFMVRELNEMDEITSIRLINEITSMLKREGTVYRSTNTDHAE